MLAAWGGRIRIASGRGSTVCCVFFFSSRRRHTRCSRDWSSDVCSSDLERRLRLDERQTTLGDGPSEVRGARSEERRVGKECRSRGGRDEQKKKREKVDRLVRPHPHEHLVVYRGRNVVVAAA